MKNVVSAYIERWNLVLGVIFVVIISFMPEGLVPGSVRLCDGLAGAAQAVGRAGEARGAHAHERARRGI